MCLSRIRVTAIKEIVVSFPPQPGLRFLGTFPLEPSQDRSCQHKDFVFLDNPLPTSVTAPLSPSSPLCLDR